MIVLLDLLILAALFGVAILFVTQVGLPLAYGTPLFPNFRKDTEQKVKVDAAEHELEEAREYVHLREELDEINRRKAQLEKKE